jgi:TolB-like protein/DNA-binding winged helix-turn-helix (wHTH) protein/Flp pilus assembly protein TadD
MSAMGEDSNPGDNRAACRYLVGDLVLDTGRKIVTRRGIEVVLPPLSFDLFELLVKAAPNVLSNEAIAAAVWPGLVVTPETVTQRVKLLRQALEDDAREPRYIAGIRGRGYRLIETVGVEDEASQPGAALPPSSGKAGLARWIAVVAATAGIAALAAVLATRLRDAAGTAGPQSVTVTALPATAVAVLAFENMTGDPANDQLAVGLADSVLHRLTSQRDLLVIARASSFAASVKGLGAREAGQRLGARYLVSGSLQLSGDRLRMAAQLLDAQTNRTVRSFTLDRRREDLFIFADDVASRVAEALQVNLGGAPAQYARFGLDAYLAYLRGRSLLATRQVGKVARAGAEFREAVRLAPDFASAWVSLAESMYLDAFINRHYRDRQDALWRDVAPILEKAIALEPDNGEAYYLRGRMRVSMKGGEVEAGEADFRRGIELSPNYAPGLEDYAEWLLWSEREAEGLAVIDRARSVDPLDPRNHYMKGMFLWEYRGLEDEAVALLLQALRVDPEFYSAYLRLAQIRWQQGRLAEAVVQAEHAVAIEPEAQWVRDRLAWFYIDLGDLAAAGDVIRSFKSPMPSTVALACYRDGKVASAAALHEAALRVDPFDQYGYGAWLAEGAMVEHAQAGGSTAAALQTLMSLDGMTDGQGALSYDPPTLLTAIHVATLKRAAGRRAEAEEVDRRILEALDHRRGLGRPGSAGLLRALALGHLGRKQDALTELEQVAASTGRMGAWALFGREPFFAELHEEPRFKALAKASAVWLEGQRRELARYRESGQVPRRPPSAAPPCPDGRPLVAR